VRDRRAQTSDRANARGDLKRSWCDVNVLWLLPLAAILAGVPESENEKGVLP